MTNDTNPLLQSWDTLFGLPPFARVQAEHFAPALEAAMHAHRTEIDSIATSGDAPTFANTVAAFDRAGRTLGRVELLFHNLCASETSPALQAVERQMAPRLAAHHNAILLSAKLFSRIDRLHAERANLSLRAEELRLLERIHTDFALAGARLSAAAKKRLEEIVERLAALTTQFSQNVLADESSDGLVLHNDNELAGLPEQVRAAAREAARERGEPDAWVIALNRSLIVPFLTFSDRRDLRERAFKKWIRRGENNGPRDNRPLAREILALRHEQACLHGYACYAAYALVDRMAKTPLAVATLLAQVWEPAKAKADAECEALRAMALSRGENLRIEPWDWRYYAEKVRKARYDFDEGSIKPYFSLERMLSAAFDCAHRLFGVRFVEQPRYPALSLRCACLRSI